MHDLCQQIMLWFSAGEEGMEAKVTLSDEIAALHIDGKPLPYYRPERRYRSRSSYAYGWYGWQGWRDHLARRKARERKARRNADGG